MSRVAILCYILEPGGVGNDAFGMADLLSSRGHEVQLFAEVWSRTPHPVRRFEELAAFLEGDPSACLIYHFIIGWEPGLRILQAARCRRVVRYHNVTPPEFFEEFNPAFAKLCRLGREQIGPVVRAGAELYLSDSDYNARDLLQAGLDAPRSQVVPPLHRIDRLEAAVPDAEVLRRFGDPGVTNVLAVGRVVPNKRHELLIEALAECRAGGHSSARLLIVGARDQVVYDEKLARLIDRLGLRDAVHFAGPVSEEALRAYYQVATVLLSASEHEGFCIPLIEAMALGAPIVAVGSSAVPGTVGKAGLVWEERDPELLAGSIEAIAADPRLRDGLRTEGRRRYLERFTNQVIGGQLLAALGPVLG